MVVIGTEISWLASSWRK